VLIHTVGSKPEWLLKRSSSEGNVVGSENEAHYSVIFVAIIRTECL